MVSSPLLLSGLSPAEFRSKGIRTEAAPEYQKAPQNNESFSFSVGDNQTSQVRTSVVGESQYNLQYSLSGVLASLILGAVAAALSYFAIKREVVKRIRLQCLRGSFRFLEIVLESPDGQRVYQFYKSLSSLAYLPDSNKFDGLAKYLGQRGSRDNYNL